jgi:hypothetical protein
MSALIKKLFTAFMTKLSSKKVKLVYDDIVEDTRKGGYLLMSIFPYYEVLIFPFYFFFLLNLNLLYLQNLTYITEWKFTRRIRYYECKFINCTIYIKINYFIN